MDHFADFLHGDNGDSDGNTAARWWRPPWHAHLSSYLAKNNGTGTMMFTVKVTGAETGQYYTSVPNIGIDDVLYDGSGAIQNIGCVPTTQMFVSAGTLYDEYQESESEFGVPVVIAISKVSFGQSFDCKMKVRYTDNDGYYWDEDLTDVFNYYDMFDVRRDYYVIENEDMNE